MDLNMGRIKVSVNGFKPLHFVSDMEFGVGEEIAVNLQYERLHGFCRRCHSLCHNEDMCGITGGASDTSCFRLELGTFVDPKALSYKGALIQEGDMGQQKEKNGTRRGKGISFSEMERAGTKVSYSESRSREGMGRQWAAKTSNHKVADKLEGGLVNKRSGSGEKKEDTTKTLLGGKEELIPAEDGALHKESQMVNLHENGVLITGESSEIAEEMVAPVGDLRMAEDTEGLQENREEGDILSLEYVVLKEPNLCEDGESGPEMENAGAMEASDKKEDKSELGDGKQGVRKRLFPATSIGRGMGSRK